MRAAWPLARRKHGALSTYQDGCRCIVCITEVLVSLHRCALWSEYTVASSNLLPEDFDDDTRITSAQLQYHPPQAWVQP